MPTFRLATLGCKVNQYETQYLREGLMRLGYEPAKAGEPADLCFVNTCTVTSEGDLKSRKAIRRFSRQNPTAEIIVAGCYASRSPDELAALPNVSEVIRDKAELPDFLRRRGLLAPPDGIESFGPRQRAYVKVQDGCNQNCTYCIIPTVRPILRSRSIDSVLREVDSLLENGCRELVLTGIHLGHYGRDIEGSDANLDRLVEQLVAHETSIDFRLRLSSLEAVEVTDRLLELMRDRPDRICPHLHLSMQSGSDSVLERMGRRWPRARFIEHCLRAKEMLDRPAVTTDVIVGFPGETEAEFQKTCDAAREIGFSKIHIFRFSPRDGTPAAEMNDQIAPAVKQERAARLAVLEEELRNEYFEQLIGSEIQVLVERTIRDQLGSVMGTSDRYAMVVFPGGAQDVGRLVNAEIVRRESDRLLGERR
jgi:threonylcarbamoyladenosine tRNA methylthiotransferase MtaB